MVSILYLTDEHYAIAEANGIDRRTAYDRFYNRGWSVEKTITKPKKVNKPFKALLEEACPNYKEILEKHGISYITLYQRIVKEGMSIEEALNTPKRAAGNKGRWGRAARKGKISEEYIKLAEANGINISTLRARVLTYHWDIEKAATTPVDVSKRRK